jgi:hypothetical protein
MNALDKKIYKTIIIIVTVVSVILVLFFNKLMTPRFLSSIELRLNGYVLLNADRDGNRKQSPIIFEQSSDKKQWFILVKNDVQNQLMEDFFTILKDPMKSHTEVMKTTRELTTKLTQQISDQDNFIAVINDDGKLSGYFKPPYDKTKMVLTYSSVFTHR